MQDTFKEYQQWSDDVTETSLPQYTTALNMLDKLLPCEISLVNNLAIILLFIIYVVMVTESTSWCRSLSVLLSHC